MTELTTTAERVEAFLTGSISKTDLVTLVHTVFTIEEFLDSPWSESDALAPRALWIYPDDTCLTFAPREGLFVTHLRDQLTATAQIGGEVSEIIAAPDALTWVEHANGFSILLADPDTMTPAWLVRLIDALAGSHGGAPTLLLPWEQIINEAEELTDTYVEDPDDADENLLAAIALFTGLADLNGIVPDGLLPWKTEISFGDDAMPAWSGHGRFYRFLDDLQDNRGFIVINGECCGTCASGSIRDAREENPDLADAPTFVVYEQNTDSKWGTSGWVNHLVYEPDPAALAALRAAAATEGLTIEPDPAGDDFYTVVS